MKHILVATFITLLVLGMGCAWISPASETASDGIQVHGHWTVTVTNPDGTLDAVHEFDNAFTSTGSEVVTGLLSGESTVDAWQIRFDTTDDWDCVEGIGWGQVPLVTASVTRDESRGMPLRLIATCTMEKGQSDYTYLNTVKTEAFGTIRRWNVRTQTVDNINRQVFSVHQIHPQDRPRVVGNQRVVANVLFTFVPGP